MKMKTFLIGLFCCMSISTLSGFAYKYDWCDLEKRSLIPEKNDVIIEIRPYKNLVNACIVIYDSTGALAYNETVTVSAGDVSQLLTEYDVTPQEAETEVNAFIDMLKENGIA